MKQHVVFASIKLGGLYLMICDFFFSRQDLHYSKYEELVAGPTSFIKKKVGIHASSTRSQAE